MARVFDRTNSDKIEYAYLSAIAGATKVAVSLWVYPVSSNSYDCFVGQAASGFNGITLQHNSNDATALFATARNSDNNPYHIYSSALTLNTWQNVIYQYDGAEATAANRVRVYVDAGSALTPGASGGTFPTTIGTEGTPLFTLGSSLGTYWSGRIAGVWVWQGIVLDGTARTALAAGDLGSVVQPSGLILDDGLWQGTTPTNAVTAAAATVTGTTETTDPPLLDPQPSAGQPFAKRRGGVIHAVGAQPLGVRRW